jgi:hypothetical protein
MAIIKFGGGIAGIRGTIAGTTFTANKSGAYAKSWSKGPNPNSTTQSAQRYNLTNMSKSWAAVPEADKADWDTWASDPAQELINALGDPYYLSGFQWYVKCNTWLKTANRNPITTYPSSAWPAIADSIALTCAANPSYDCHLDWALAHFDPDDLIFAFSLAQNDGPTKPPYRPREFLGFDPSTYTSVSLLYWINQQMGLPPVSSKLFVDIYRQTTDGLRGPSLQLTGIFT